MVESTKTKKIVIFGATGRTGVQLCKHAISKGYHVTAFLRNPNKLQINEGDDLVKIQADLFDPQAMRNAVKGKDAVVVALGGYGLLCRDYTCSTGTRAIITAMKEEKIERLIVCTSYGVGPGNRTLLPCFPRFLLYHPLADKDVQEADITTSGLNFTIVRPPRLKDLAGRGEANLHAM